MKSCVTVPVEGPPVRYCSRNTSAHSAMIPYVTTGESVRVPRRTAVRMVGWLLGALCRASFTHSGQCTPTAAWV